MILEPSDAAKIPAHSITQLNYGPVHLRVFQYGPKYARGECPTSYIDSRHEHFNCKGQEEAGRNCKISTLWSLTPHRYL